MDACIQAAHCAQIRRGGAVTVDDMIAGFVGQAREQGFRAGRSMELASSLPADVAIVEALY